MTTNEIVCFTDLGYKIGQFAPGLRLPDAQVNQIRHHGILAHGPGVQAVRANARPSTQVGLAENATVFAPVIETDADIAAAQKATREGNAPFLTAFPIGLEGPEAAGGLVGDPPPQVLGGEELVALLLGAGAASRDVGQHEIFPDGVMVGLETIHAPGMSVTGTASSPSWPTLAVLTLTLTVPVEVAGGIRRGLTTVGQPSWTTATQAKAMAMAGKGAPVSTPTVTPRVKAKAA